MCRSTGALKFDGISGPTTACTGAPSGRVWVADVVENDLAFDPADVGVLGAVGIVLEPYCIAHLVEELLGWLCHGGVPKSGFGPGAGF
jgi:hypothetical protein